KVLSPKADFAFLHVDKSARRLENSTSTAENSTSTADFTPKYSAFLSECAKKRALLLCDDGNGINLLSNKVRSAHVEMGKCPFAAGRAKLKTEKQKNETHIMECERAACLLRKRIS
ncbi:MAG: hypothetical protein IKT26_04675, partial [Bacteroidaceae bacterium]|nr:hypothetical protein [Bacteroidaceae bacterium]